MPDLFVDAFVDAIEPLSTLRVLTKSRENCSLWVAGHDLLLGTERQQLGVPHCCSICPQSAVCSDTVTGAISSGPSYPARRVTAALSDQLLAAALMLMCGRFG